MSRVEFHEISKCSVVPAPLEDLFDAEFLHQIRGSDAGADSNCWMPSSYSRLVLIVIDALRFDFAAENARHPNSSLPFQPRLHTVEQLISGGAAGFVHHDDESSQEQHEDEAHFHGNYYLHGLPVLHQVLRDHPDRAMLFRSLVDSPTVTQQRLKAITTGGIPTFLDLNDATFETSAVREDNWVRQFRAQGRRISTCRRRSITSRSR